MKHKNELRAYGLKLLLPEHEAIKTLEKEYKPANYGHQVWDSSWLLIDYLQHFNGISAKSIMDIGCGWGLAGIYCARAFGAGVSCVDVDDQVQPYVELMAAINNVQVDFLNLAFHQINRDLLNRTDLIIGSDICFCEGLINPLYNFIKIVESASVKQMIISDPGRWTFNDLSQYFNRNGNAEVLEWKITTPVDVSGKILRIQF